MKVVACLLAEGVRVISLTFEEVCCLVKVSLAIFCLFRTGIYPLCTWSYGFLEEFCCGGSV